MPSSNDPDVIQIGDSSGFHAIVPRIVDQYLGGLKYENLSCCANTGFDGYYTIAEFMLRNTPSIKAVVLYMSLNNPPRDPATVADRGGWRRRSHAKRLWLAGSVHFAAYIVGTRGDPADQCIPSATPSSSRGCCLSMQLGRTSSSLFEPTKDGGPNTMLHRTAEKHSQMLSAMLCGPTGVSPLAGYPGPITPAIFSALGNLIRKLNWDGWLISPPGIMQS